MQCTVLPGIKEQKQYKAQTKVKKKDLKYAIQKVIKSYGGYGVVVARLIVNQLGWVQISIVTPKQGEVMGKRITSQRGHMRKYGKKLENRKQRKQNRERTNETR